MEQWENRVYRLAGTGLKTHDARWRAERRRDRRNGGWWDEQAPLRQHVASTQHGNIKGSMNQPYFEGPYESGHEDHDRGVGAKRGVGTLDSMWSYR